MLSCAAWGKTSIKCTDLAKQKEKKKKMYTGINRIKTESFYSLRRYYKSNILDFTLNDTTPFLE